MRRFAGACRFVYNKALTLQKENHEAGGKFIGYVAMANLLPAWKKEFAWLKDSPSQTLQHALKNLERAYKNFFEKRTDFPRFKKRGVADSFRFPQGFEVDQANNRIKLPKLGWITRFATLSDGSFIAPLNSFKKHQIRLARYQCCMARKVKFSKNWRKAKSKVQKIHSHIAHCRKDFLHKASTSISQNHALVCVEDLQIRNMSKSSKGNGKNHGKRVRQKSGLNRSILDQGWPEFRQQLEYKTHWNGGVVVAVGPHYTSQACPACGHVAKENRQTQAKFACLDCGYENNADVVGAMNVLARGHRVLACGEGGSGLVRKRKTKPASVKQEPFAVTICEVTHA